MSTGKADSGAPGRVCNREEKSRCVFHDLFERDWYKGWYLNIQAWKGVTQINLMNGQEYLINGKMMQADAAFYWSLSAMMMKSASLR